MEHWLFPLNSFFSSDNHLVMGMWPRELLQGNCHTIRVNVTTTEWMSHHLSECHLCWYNQRPGYLYMPGYKACAKFVDLHHGRISQSRPLHLQISKMNKSQIFYSCWEVQHPQHLHEVMLSLAISWFHGIILYFSSIIRQTLLTRNIWVHLQKMLENCIKRELRENSDKVILFYQHPSCFWILILKTQT